jgi:hypothetical protein
MCLMRHHIVMLRFSSNSLSLLSPTNHTAASLQTSVVLVLIKSPRFTIRIRQNGKHEFSLHWKYGAPDSAKLTYIKTLLWVSFGLCSYYSNIRGQNPFVKKIRVPTLYQPGLRLNQRFLNHVTELTVLIIIQILHILITVNMSSIIILVT